MSHRPFEEWLFVDDALAAEQEQELRDHLADCRSCQALSEAWSEVSGQLGVVPMVAPAPGFVSRWETRLEKTRVRAQRRQLSTVLGLTALGTAVLFLVLGGQLAARLSSPAELGAQWLRAAFDLKLFAKVGWGFAAALADGLPHALPSAGWAVLGSLFIGLSALWVATVYRYAFQTIEGVKR